LNKKKDKFKTIGQEMKLKNMVVGDIDDIYFYESSQSTKTKTSKKKLEIREQTHKSNVILNKGRIVEVNSNYTYKVDIEGEKSKCFLSGRLKYLAHNTRNPIAVGDYVNVDTSDPKNLRIEEIYPRKSTLSRFVEDNKLEVLIATNIDQIVVVVSVREPDFKSTLIDRYICVAEITHIPLIVCINKIDLANDLSEIKEECSYYEKCGYQVIYTSVQNKNGIDTLETALKDKDSLFTGHSGTGKSSLINSLEPSINLKVGQVSAYNKGTHTTTNSRMIAWSFGGNLVDTPGIKTLGLSTEDLVHLPSSFPGFSKYVDHCAFANCTHTHEENCAIKENIGKTIPEKRYNSYLRIRENL
jgi:ribosome biogenesis GTPase